MLDSAKSGWDHNPHRGWSLYDIMIKADMHAVSAALLNLEELRGTYRVKEASLSDNPERHNIIPSDIGPMKNAVDWIEWACSEAKLLGALRTLKTTRAWLQNLTHSTHTLSSAQSEICHVVDAVVADLGEHSFFIWFPIKRSILTNPICLENW